MKKDNIPSKCYFLLFVPTCKLKFENDWNINENVTKTKCSKQSSKNFKLYTQCSERNTLISDDNKCF